MSTILYIPFVLASLFLMYVTWNNFQKTSTMDSWIPTEATIHKPINKDGKDNIYFRYFVDGAPYFSRLTQDPIVANELSNVKKIKVWVNPNKPEQATAVKGWNRMSWILLAFTVSFTSFLIAHILKRSTEITLLGNKQKPKENTNAFIEISTETTVIENRKKWATILFGISLVSFLFIFTYVFYSQFSDAYSLCFIEKIKILD